MEKKYLRVKEAAAVMNLTERATWAAIYRGQLPATRWGRRVLIPVDGLKKLISELNEQAA